MAIQGCLRPAAAMSAEGIASLGRWRASVAKKLKWQGIDAAASRYWVKSRRRVLAIHKSGSKHCDSVTSCSGVMGQAVHECKVESCSCRCPTVQEAALLLNKSSRQRDEPLSLSLGGMADELYDRSECRVAPFAPLSQ